MCVNRIFIIFCYFYLAHKSGNTPRGLSNNQSIETRFIFIKMKFVSKCVLRYIKDFIGKLVAAGGGGTMFFVFFEK